MILPPDVAEAARSGEGFGSGVTAHYAPTVNALDARGVESVLMRHADVIAKAMRQQVHDNSRHLR
jgi:hypothetical protein